MRVACVFIHGGETAITAFAEACLRFSPQIALREPNVVFIEIGRCKTLYSESSFLGRVRVLLERFKLKANVTIASDIPTALASARYAIGHQDLLPIAALSDYGDPFGVDEAGRKSIVKMAEAMERLGIKTIGQLKQVPASQFSSRFGGLGLYCRQRIDGGAAVMWPQWNPPEKFLERYEFMPSEQCMNLEPLLFHAKSLLDRVFSRLRGRLFRAERIRFWIELEKYSVVKQPLREWNFELITPQGSASGFLPILKERLYRDLAKAPVESFVIAMGCEVASMSLSKSAQKNLFHASDDFQEAMGTLFGQLEEFLGPGNVFWTQVTEERFPEQSWRRTRKTEEGESANVRGRYPTRPSRIFKKPEPIGVLHDRIILRGRAYHAQRWSTVERISLHWLDEAPARNYYRVDLEGGRALWVFSDSSQRYFAHGYFE